MYCCYLMSGIITDTYPSLRMSTRFRSRYVQREGTSVWTFFAGSRVNFDCCGPFDRSWSEALPSLYLCVDLLSHSSCMGGTHVSAPTIYFSSLSQSLMQSDEKSSTCTSLAIPCYIIHMSGKQCMIASVQMMFQGEWQVGTTRVFSRRHIIVFERTGTSISEQ